MSLPISIRDFENQIDGVMHPTDVDHGPISAVVAAIRLQHWHHVLELAESLFFRVSTDEERAFLLFCATATCEMQSDTRKRTLWMKRWDQVVNQESNLYCKYVRFYQHGLSAFFAGYLSEADFRFAHALQAARALGFRNGEMRALYHIALICRDRRDNHGAHLNLTLALNVACEIGAELYEKQIRRVLVSLDVKGERDDLDEACGDENLTAYAVQIEKRLRDGDIQVARELLVRGEKLRRRLKIGRRMANFYAYLPLIHLMRQKPYLFQLSMAWISDPLMVVTVLELKEKLTGLSTAETERLYGLYALHGLSSALRVNTAEPEQSELFGKKLAQVEDIQVRKLFMAFLESKEYSLSKEDLCRRVWGLPYDPVIHDGRIYKLIHRARSHFPGKDLFANTYGGYRLKVASGLRSKVVAS